MQQTWRAWSLGGPLVSGDSNVSVMVATSRYGISMILSIIKPFSQYIANMKQIYLIGPLFKSVCGDPKNH